MSNICAHLCPICGYMVLLCPASNHYHAINMDDHYLRLRVVWHDVHMIELETRVRHGDWSASSRTYASPDFLTQDAQAIIDWARTPDHPLRLTAGADNGSGWLVLEFYTIDRAKHARCAITLATQIQTFPAPRPAETWRFNIELPTELGLIEEFGLQCLALGRDFNREARLCGLAT